MLVAWGAVAFAAEDADRWRLEHIYATVEAWEAARAKVEREIPSLTDCRGKLGTDAATFLGCLEQQASIGQELGRLSSYASNHVSVDTRDDAWQAREAAVQILFTRQAEATAWFEPELLALGAEKVDAFLKAEPKLKAWDYPLHAALRRGEHVLDPEGERLLALSGALTSAPSDSYVTFANAELPWPTVTLPDGTTTRLAQPDFARLRSHADPAVRKLVFDEFFGTLADYEATIGTLLAAQVQAHWFHAQARGYPSSVEAALANDFLPREVYDTLVAQAGAHLPTLHRYLKLREDMLGLEELTYADLYVPLVASDRKFSLEESKALALASAKPLGKAYVAAMKEGLDAGWIDAYPREGKIPGAYMDGVYGVHPYVLLNHQDDFESAGTLAHEYGHAMHTWLAHRAQPYPTAGYPTFLAEVASTFDEALLSAYVLDRAKTDEERLFYLGSALEDLRTTFFRQAMFAEVELAMHEMAERGEPITGSALTAKYAEILRRYYGADQGVVRIDDAWTREWASVPHFYYDFYVFQYATSIAASSLLAGDVVEGRKGASERFLGLLEAGGNGDPYVLLKDAGVDMATAAPYDALAARMEAIMDEIEALRAKRKK